MTFSSKNLEKNHQYQWKLYNKTNKFCYFNNEIYYCC